MYELHRGYKQLPRGALKNFAKLTKKYLFRSISLSPATILRKRLQHICVFA